MGIKQKVLDEYWKWILISDKTTKEELFEAYENGIEVVIDNTLAEVEKVIDDVLDSKKSKKIIDKGLKEDGIPKEFAFQEKYFYLSQDFMKEEIKERLRGK